MRGLEIAWTEPAVAEVSAYIDFLAELDPDAAERWYRAVIQAIERASGFPHIGRVVPELSREDVREVIVSKHRVIYRVTATHLVVWSVHHGHRPLAPDVVADELT